MKNLIKILLASLLVFFFQSCSSQGPLDQASVDALINSKEFTFHAERANPSAADGYNIINNMPNAGTRLLQLDSGDYGVDILNDKVESTLPYFGRVFGGSGIGSQDNSGYRFTSKDYTISETKNKKGNYVITIQPKDINYVRTMILEVFKNGRASLSIDSNQRQPISYDGFIAKKEKTKD